MNRHPVPWPQAWQEALYGPDGFYRGADGPVRHFSTSATGIPHADAVMARAVVALARRQRRSTVVDLGAGRGSLIGQVARAAPDLRCVGVDVVPAPATLPDGVDWWVGAGGEHLPPQVDTCTGALVVAHEWLDVVPTTVARRDAAGVWRAGEVDVRTGQESFDTAVSEEERVWLETWTDADTIVAEVGLTREHALAELYGHLHESSVLVVDYGHVASQRPVEGSLVGYRQGEVQRPLPDGSMDLTAHVAMDALCASMGQDVLVRARQSEILGDLIGPAHVDQRWARSRPAAYLQQVAEHAAAHALSQRGGLGDFWWVLIEPPARLSR